MPVTRRFLTLLACVAALAQLASDAWPQVTPQLSGLGYIDFRTKPKFKVGDWVRYHFRSKADGGVTEDYTMTILISGEEKFWGDDCFWVETWSGGKSLQTQTTAYLMSYSIFGDSLWLEHLQVYQRKLAYRDPDQQLVQELVHRSMKSKPTTDLKPAITTLVDTLGADTATVALGTYRCVKVRRKAGIGMVDDRGDSTMRNENWDQRTLYLSSRVPMTSLVREVDDRWITQKTWKVGKSEDAIQKYVLRGRGSLDLEAYGSGDLKPLLTPEYAWRGLMHPVPAHGASRTTKRRGA